MIVDIISAGPSAKEYRPCGAITVGVNRSVMLFECDYWVVLDFEGYELISPFVKGMPQIVTCGNACRKLDNLGVPYIKTAYGDIPYQYKPTEFSIVAAKYFVHKELKASVVNIYGDDKVGGVDCADNIDSSRINNRWKREIVCEGLLKQYMEIN